MPSPLVDLEPEHGTHLLVHPDNIGSVEIHECVDVHQVFVFVHGKKYHVGEAQSREGADTLTAALLLKIWG